MTQSLKEQPYFTLLLPVFFVIHGFAEHYGFITIKDIAFLGLTYCFFTLLIYSFSYFFFRNRIKSGLMTAAWISFFLFFGAFYDFVKLYSPAPFFYKYSVLLGFCMLMLIALFVLLKKARKPFHRFTFFLNILLLVYLVIDIATIGWKAINPPVNKLANYDFAKDNQYKIPDTCAKPDIYLLLFDEYASSKSLKERFGFENDIDSFLQSAGFSVQSASKSNYNYTPFSMASLLNMNYLEDIDYRKGVDREDFLNCNILIRENQVIKFLGMNGYEIVNLSIFDLAGHPSHLSQSILPVRTRMITEGTLFPRLYRDFEWFFAKYHLLSEDLFFKHVDNNQEVLKDVKKISAAQEQQPRFVYAHFYMPHFPFYFDRYGNRKADTTVVREFNENSIPAYLDYVLYVNTEMKKLVNTIQQNTGGKAVIIVLADHGLKWKSGIPRIFQNMNAVYFPNGNYNQLYDSMTNVNLFPVIFNTLFRQSYPVLKDTSFMLLDKK